MAAKSSRTGIVERHSTLCRTMQEDAPEDARCNCSPSFEAWIFDRRAERRDADGNLLGHGKKVRKSFASITEAKQWRADNLGNVRRGTLRATAPLTLREAASAWLAGARDGTIATRSGDAYKPSALRSYEGALNKHVLPELGAHRLAALTLRDVQDFVDRLKAAQHDASTVRNILMPLRAIYRRALSRGEVAINPTVGLELPAVRGRRDRIAPPHEAAQLLAALPETDRCLWAVALYAGLRAGELMGLRWSDVVLKDEPGGRRAGIYVERSYDPKASAFIEPKSRAGKRRVPILRALSPILLAHKARCAWSGASDGLVFGNAASRPFDYWATVSRAKAAWKKAKLTSIGLHECRHTCASLFIAAGVNPKAVSTILGHASVTITLDRYGHLFPGSEDEAGEMVDTFIDRALAAAGAA